MIGWVGGGEEGLEFECQVPKNLSVMVCLCNPSGSEAEIGRSLGIAGLPVKPTWQVPGHIESLPQ